MKTKVFTLISLIIVLAFVLSACQPTTVEVVKTVVVEKEGQTIIETQIVEVPVEVQEAASGPVMADGMIACLPLPSIAASENGVHLAKMVAASNMQPKNTALGELVLSPTNQTGDVYKVGVFEDVTTMNFWGANGPDNTVWNSYMLPERLSLYSLTAKYFTVVPSVAKALPDPLAQEGEYWVVVLPIRDDILWSDGTSFTANDVAFTANTVLRLGLLSGNFGTWFDAKFLDRVEAVDDYTVKIFYHTKPGYLRHEYGYLQSPILQEAYWKPVVDEAAAGIDALAADASDEDKATAQAEAHDKLFAHSPDGEPTAGAFTLVKWEPGAFIDAAAYADYHDSGLVIEQWPDAAYRDSDGVVIGEPEGDPETTYEIGPNVSSVIYTVYGSQDAAILALKSGEVDFVINPLGLQKGLENQVKSDPNLTWLENSVNGFRYLSFNNRRQPMNDCSFRQAVSVLIDKEFVTKTILQGVAFPLYTFVPVGNAAWYFDDVPKLGQGMTREERTNLAVAILEQAGYTWEGDQKPIWDGDNRQVVAGGRLLMPDGTPVPPLKMLAPSPGYDPLRSTFAIWIETWMNEFGIPLEANLAGFNVIVPKIFTEQDFDMYMLGWSLSITPDFLYDFFAEEQAVFDGNNAGGYVNPVFEETAIQLLTCETFEECKVLSDELQQILATEAPYVLLFDTGIFEAYRSASVEYPFTNALSGLQYYHQTGGPLQSVVKIK